MLYKEKKIDSVEHGVKAIGDHRLSNVSENLVRIITVDEEFSMADEAVGKIMNFKGTIYIVPLFGSFNKLDFQSYEELFDSLFSYSRDVYLIEYLGEKGLQEFFSKRTLVSDYIESRQISDSDAIGMIYVAGKKLGVEKIALSKEVTLLCEKEEKAPFHKVPVHFVGDGHPTRTYSSDVASIVTKK